ncbi:uncharacterized protein HaLaN_22100 [Haematococcus lacustris]|uniref:Uncharacterized protein n=1 Tax=Haematococcus lacustris TaxID=44745 RepID=A0A699ZZK9_HAELA|nr:uncharacterized protein HaLaN_22100 [Haematococcus lacustris]
MALKAIASGHCTTHRSTMARRSSIVSSSQTSQAVRKLPDALFFDCDGVLVDTERDGHRVSFNKAFAEKGLDHEWSVERYGKLLEIGGGKERMTKYFEEEAHRPPFSTNQEPAARQALVQQLHLLKTDLFMQLVESGAMPLRPGVKRLIGGPCGCPAPARCCQQGN